MEFFKQLSAIVIMIVLAISPSSYANSLDASVSSNEYHFADENNNTPLLSNENNNPAASDNTKATLTEPSTVLIVLGGIFLLLMRSNRKHQ